MRHRCSSGHVTAQLTTFCDLTDRLSRSQHQQSDFALFFIAKREILFPGKVTMEVV
jgi:hypothetical protein